MLYTVAMTYEGWKKIQQQTVPSKQLIWAFQYGGKGEHPSYDMQIPSNY